MSLIEDLIQEFRELQEELDHTKAWGARVQTENEKLTSRLELSELQNESSKK